MVNLWFTEADIKYRWSEVKNIFWDEFRSWRTSRGCPESK